MSEYISIGDSLIITAFSISMVFLVLIVISIFISFLKNIDNKKEKEILEDAKIVTKSSPDLAKPEENKTLDDEELVAVISAAIAASLGVSMPQINIKKINRISGKSTAWSAAGKQEQLDGKL